MSLPFLPRRRSKKAAPITAMTATTAPRISGKGWDPDEDEDGDGAGAAPVVVVGGAAAASSGLVVNAGAGAFRALSGSTMP